MLTWVRAVCPSVPFVSLFYLNNNKLAFIVIMLAFTGHFFILFILPFFYFEVSTLKKLQCYFNQTK